MPKPKMKKTQFEAIASILRAATDSDNADVLGRLAWTFASYLATQSPTFEREKFLSLCTPS